MVSIAPVMNSHACYEKQTNTLVNIIMKKMLLSQMKLMYTCCTTLYLFSTVMFSIMYVICLKLAIN